MIQKLELFSVLPSAPVLSLSGFMPSDDPVQIRNIEGLGPVKADIVSTGFASGRGELYQGSTTPKRNIVLTLGLNPNWDDQTVSSLRQLLYAYLMPEQWCKLRFFSDHLPTCDIEGYVESFEPNMFSEDPEVQVSIINPKPDFIDVDATLLTGMVDDGTFETVFTYLGSVATGFELRIEITPANVAYTGSFIITNVGLEEQAFAVDPVTINVAKYFKLNSVRNSKRASNIAVADGASTNLLAQVTTDSVWPEIVPGENVLTVVGEETDLLWTLAYFNRFGGL